MQQGMGIRQKRTDIFVGSLPKDTTEHNVRELYQMYGPISSVSVQDSVGKYEGTRRAFVRFLYEGDARNAVAGTNGKCIGGKSIIVYIPNLENSKMKGRPLTGPMGDAPTKPIRRAACREPDTAPSLRESVRPLMEPISVEQIAVTHVDDACNFWGQLSNAEKAQQILTISELLMSVCPSAPHVKGRPHRNKIYGAQFSEDAMWYRCMVVEYVSDSQTKVQYIDYGNTEIVNNSAIVDLTQDALVRDQGHAQHYRLRDLVPVSTDTSNQEFQMGLDYMKKLALQKLAEVKVFLVQDGTFMVEAVVCDINLNDEMLRLSFAETKIVGPGTRTVSNETRQTDTTSYDMISTGRPHKNENKAVWPKEMYQMKSELEAIRAERQSLITELSSTKGKLKILQSEYNNANLTQKLKNVLAKVQAVKKLRTLFPTDNDVENSIVTAIHLVQAAESRIRLTELEVVQNVSAARDSYQKAQDTIRACSDVDVLDSLIKVRDEARVNLSRQIDCFMIVTSRLPINERCSALKLSMETLREKYKTFLQYRGNMELILEKCLPVYETWKEKKDSVLLRARTSTNTRHNAVESALQLLNQQLSLNLKSVEENSVNPSNLDHLINRLNEDITEEIHCSDLEKIGTDTAIIATIIQCVLGEMEKEFSDVEKLGNLVIEYGNINESISNWLSAKPDTDAIHVVRKVIKGLKSKLRHKIADITDMEDSEESDTDTLADLNQDLILICSRLHQAFLEEDVQLAYLAKLQQDHFPELKLQNPDIDIDNEVANCNLVKMGRDLEQYVVKKKIGKEGKQNVLMTTFNEKEVVLKEYFYSDRQEFLNKLKIFMNISSCNVLMPQFMFFLKNGCQTYVQYPLLQNVANLVSDDETLSQKVRYHILNGILTGIEACHVADHTHTAIHPYNVFVNSSGEGILGDFDFTKAASQRSAYGVTMDNGLHFTAPEVEAGSEPTVASDLYNFGLIVLWLHFPSHKFKKTTDGLPDISGLTKDEKLLEVLRKLLVGNPMSRATLKDLKSMPYFLEEPASPIATDPPKEMQPETLQLRRTSLPSLRTSPVAGSPVSILKNGGSPPVQTNGAVTPCLCVKMDSKTDIGPVQDHEKGVSPNGATKAEVDIDQGTSSVGDNHSCNSSLLDEDVPSDGSDILTPVPTETGLDIETSQLVEVQVKIDQAPKKQGGSVCVADVRKMIDDACSEERLVDVEGLSEASKTSSFELLTEHGNTLAAEVGASPANQDN